MLHSIDPGQTKVFGDGGIYTNFKKYRDFFLDNIEKIFKIMCLMLGIFVFLWWVAGINCFRSKEFAMSNFHFQSIKTFFIFFMTFQCLFLMSCSVCGCRLASNRNCKTGFIFLFGFTLLFFGSIPMMAEGDAMRELTTLSFSDVYEMCEMSNDKIQDQPKWVRSFIQGAKRFDLLSEQLVNQNMCTQTCPCMQGNESKDKMLNAKINYENIGEEWLNKYNRTLTSSTKNGLKPFVWTTDKDIGFDSFMNCYQFWLKKSESEDIKLEDKFDIPKNKYGDSEKSFIDNREHRPMDMSMIYLVEHMNEASIYQYYEDDFKCSGICNVGLFYFHRKIIDGPPEITCFVKFLEGFQKSAKGFEVFTVLCGVVAFFIFLAHFLLYFRPWVDEEGKDTQAQRGRPSALAFMDSFINVSQVPRSSARGQRPPVDQGGIQLEFNNFESVPQSSDQKDQKTYDI